ncbi:alpha/beta fold hydrolase [Kribbella sancticallisti]|uniref:alpha/beta fold hydrolase n=1 Tax=Kribbella sancticallisti TaxID=460087 RepID=UPI003CD07A1A
MFEGFTLDRIDVGEVGLRVRYGGSGPAVVLLHGHPRTHTTWYQVAPALAESGFTVVCPDLRGYGQSGKPASDDDHTPYSKRAMAADVANLMVALGHEQYAVAGHDRGSYVAYPHRPGPPRGRHQARGDGQRAVGRGARTLRRPVRRPVVALVVLRADRQARRTGDLRRSRDLVRGLGRELAGRPRAGEPRRLPGRDPRPRHRARHGRGLPRRPGRRPPQRRGGPGRRAADHLPHDGSVVDEGRHGGHLRRSGGRLDALVPGAAGRVRDRLPAPRRRKCPG